MPKQLSVVIGRFQLTELHAGHRKLLETAKTYGDHVLVLVGSAQEVATYRNPLPYDVRVENLRRSYPDFLYAPLNDNSSDHKWSEDVDDRIKGARLLTACDTVRIYHARDSFKPHYFGIYQTEEIHSLDCSASAMREMIGKSRYILSNENCQRGIIWATQQGFPQVTPTVDIACIDARWQMLLVGRKKDETQWRLPGGFVDLTDESYIDAAKRELLEECGGNLKTSDWHISNSFKIKDWRFTGNRGIMTTLVSCFVVEGEPCAGDDLADVKWVKTLGESSIVPEHREMFRFLKRIS